MQRRTSQRLWWPFQRLLRYFLSAPHRHFDRDLAQTFQHQTMPWAKPHQKPRRTLRQALRDLLRRNAAIHRDESHQQSVGSGILRKAPTSAPLLPSFSAVSSFPDFSTLRYSTISLVSSSTTSTAMPRTSRMPRVTRPGRQLLPSMSLVDLNNTYFDQSGPKQAAVHTVPEIFESGLSRQASLVSVISRPESRSSLRIRSSASLIRPDTRIGRISATEDSLCHRSQRTSGQRQSSQSNLKRSSTRLSVGQASMETQLGRICISEQSTTSREEQITPRVAETPRDPMMLIEHFKCFVVLDTALPGMPVTGTSADLRYIFDLGEQFVLNNKECEGSSFDITSSFDANGDSIVHLMLFTPLINTNSGRGRFTLVALLDVTDFIAESASQVPELDFISEESSITEEALTTPTRHSSQWSTPRAILSSDDLLGGCSLPGDEDDFPIGNKEGDEDIWLALAAAEGGLKHSRPGGYRLDRSSRASGYTAVTPSTAPSHATATDEILEFMANLQELYSDMFVLGPSPLAEDAYEICNVSPRVYESKEYIDGHLSRTAVEDIERLSKCLGGLEPFSMKVRWGSHGEEKRMYCSPLYGGPSITWICYLTNIRQPQYW